MLTCPVTTLSRWAVEQLSGALGMAGGAPGAKVGALRFLALHAFFTVEGAAAGEVHAALVTNACPRLCMLCTSSPSGIGAHQVVAACVCGTSHMHASRRVHAAGW